MVAGSFARLDVVSVASGEGKMLERIKDAQDSLPRKSVRNFPFIFILIVAVTVTVFFRDLVSFEMLRNHRDSLLIYRDHHLVGLTAAFVVVYVAIVVFSIPGAVVASITGGFLFGQTIGTLLNIFSATLGATVLFFVVRWGIGDRLMSKMNAMTGTFARLIQNLRANEVSILLLLRLVPVIPFFAANLIPVLVGVRLWNFIWTTAIGIIPGAAIYTSIGVGIGAVFDHGKEPSLGLIWEPQIIFPLAGLCVLVAMPMFVRAVRSRIVD